MKEFWIIGYGRVGHRALERLRQRVPEAAITVVDPRHRQPPEDLGEGVDWHGEDGVSFLRRRLTPPGTGAAWIIPALPRHLAYAWLAASLASSGRLQPCPVPEAVAARLPNGVRGPEGQVYISVADFICPETCREPRGVCTATGASRPCDLHAHLADLQLRDWQSLVIRSHQLAPGLGGYRGRQLTAALEAIQAGTGRWLLSTASKCHGVMHAFTT